MADFLHTLFDSSDFTARWNCGHWTAMHGWTHIVADLAIAGACVVIPFMITFVAWRRRDFPFPRIVWLFIAFVLACGATYLIDAVVFYHPIYRIGAVAKVTTAALSWVTALALVWDAPHVLKLPSITDINVKLEREVIQRRDVEQKLREQADVLQLALAAGEVGTWRWDLRTSQHTCDAGLNRILGLADKPSTQPADDFLAHVHPVDRPALEQAVNEARRGGGEYDAELRIIRPDKTVRWIRDRGRIVQDETGEQILMTGAAVDITDLRRAEEQQARLAAIVETSPHGILTQSLEGTILSWNTGAERMFGYTAEEAVGQPLDMIVPEDRQEEVTHYRSAARRGEQIPRFETVRRRKDGTSTDVWVAISPIVDRRGRLTALSSIERDITERNRYDDRLRQLNRDLQAKNEEMEQFAYIVSHDLKSPLVTMIGFVGLLREDLGAAASAEMLDELQRIEAAAQRMGRLIDDLLELSRAGRSAHEPEPVSLTAVVEGLREELDGRLQEVGATLVVEEDLPTLEADPLRIRQALQNLLVNAIKYGCTGPAPEIRIGSEQNRQEVRFFVRDNGPGIPPEYHEKVFRVFERLDPAQEGTGVGLALVARIARAHGGRAWVESSRGQGATFWIAFPAGRRRIERHG